MKKKVTRQEDITNKDLAQMIQGLGSGIKGLDLRISKLESYIKEGFDSLDNKIDYVDARFCSQIEGLGRRMDNLAENKISKITYKELESRVSTLESILLQKTKK